VITFDAEEKIRRHEDRLQPHRETFSERAFLFLRLVHELEIWRQLACGYRPAERTLREVGHDTAGAQRRVSASQMTARVDLLKTGAGLTGRLCIRAADVKRTDSHAVHRDFGELRLGVVEGLAQLRDSLGRGVGW